MSPEINRRQLLKGAMGTGMLAVLAGAGVPLLASCSSGNSGPTAEASTAFLKYLQEAGKQHAGAEINVSCINSVQSDAIKAIVSEFTDLTGIKVNMTSLAEDAAITKINVTLDAGSDAFDIYQIQNVFVAEYAEKNWFVDLDTLRSDSANTYADLDMNAFAPAANALLSAGDTQIAMPMFLATQVYYYRTDLFEQAGVSAPPTTIDELLAACDKLATSGTSAIALRGAIGATMNLYSWGSWLYNLGGNYFEGFDSATNTYSAPQLSTAKSIEAVELYADVINEFGPSGSSNWNFADITKAFLGGEVAMMQEGSPFAGTVNDPASSAVAGKVATFAMPEGPAGFFPPSGAQGWGVASASKQTGAAWLFSQWATHPETLLKAALATNFSAPPAPALLQDPEFVSKYDFGEFLASLDKSLAVTESAPIGGAYTPTLLNWQAAGHEVSTQLNAVLTKQTGAAEAMEKADVSLAKYI